jgi:hypothetical protein
MFNGYANGSLVIDASGKIVAEDIMKLRPDIQAWLDEVEKQGWRYLFIDNLSIYRMTAVAAGAPCRSFYIESGADRDPTMIDFTNHMIVQMDVGDKRLEVEEILSLEKFTINISSKNFPRAATVDLSSSSVTFLNDPFWKWEKGWEADPKKLAEAEEVYEVAKWLIETKKLTLKEPFTLERFTEVSKALDELHPQK